MSSTPKLPFGPPVRVSPLIRGARIIMLVAGIVYGRGKLFAYSRMEEAWRVEEAKREELRMKALALQKAKIAREEAQTVKDMESGKLFEPGRL